MSGTVAIVGAESTRHSDFYHYCLKLDLPDDWRWSEIYSKDVVYNRNAIVASFRGDHLLFLDDDHVFPSNLIHRLLAHDKDIVAPLYLKRYPPFTATARVDGKPVAWADANGLVSVESTGCAGLLIRRQVFAALAMPVFEHGGGLLAEDAIFCRKAREAGFEIHCDLDTRMGHFARATVWPRDGGPLFDFGEGYELRGPYA